MIRTLSLVLILVTVACSAEQNTDAVNEPLNSMTKLNIDYTSLTVSGLSSGGYMAHQLHIAYSDQVHGAAILAAGPYGCAKGKLEIALAECVDSGNPIDVRELLEFTADVAGEEKIAATHHLEDDPVWIFHGKNDTLVKRPVTQALIDYYQGLSTKIKFDFESDAGHGFPTMEFGVACSTTGQPHVNNCGLDGAGELLSHLYGKLKPKVAAEGDLIEINQGDYVDGTNTIADTGYLYLPSACRKGKRCKLHIALHGCRQNAQTIGDAFYAKAGYNEWAEANNIIVLYPQSKATYVPLNPRACWDWWGYTGDNYHFRDGAQLSHIMSMANGLSH